MTDHRDRKNRWWNMFTRSEQRVLILVFFIFLLGVSARIWLRGI